MKELRELITFLDEGSVLSVYTYRSPYVPGMNECVIFAPKNCYITYHCKTWYVFSRDHYSITSSLKEPPIATFTTIEEVIVFISLYD